MATTVHSDEVGGAEPGDDGYWPAIEILSERKHDYLVDWDGINPDTGRAWTPSWTRKTEVTEDLIEAWEAKKVTKKKSNRRASKKQRGSRASVTPTPSKLANRNSRSSRNSLTSSSHATDSPVLSLTSKNTSRVVEEPSLGKRKRRGTRHASADEDPKPSIKKQRIDGTSSSTSRNPLPKSIKDSKRISEETIREEEEEEDPGDIPRLSSTLKAGPGGAPVRIGPPRKRKKIAPLPPAAPPSSRVQESVLMNPREEEENTHEVGGEILHLDSSSQTLKKKKRRLKPPSDARPKLPTLAEKKPSVTTSRDSTQEPEEHSDQEGHAEVDPLPQDLDDEPLPDPTPPGSAMRESPDPPVDDNLPTPTPPRVNKNAKKLAPVPKLDSSHFKPYLRLEETTSVIDEFSPKKQFHTQDTIESSTRGSQTRRAAAEPPQKTPMSIDDLFDDDIVQKTQHVEDSYAGLNGQANEAELQNEEHPPTDTDDSTEQEPLRPRSPAGSEDAPVPIQSSNGRKLENALVLLNQKSEEIEVLESRLAANEAQIEHLQDENHRIQLEYEKLSVAQEVQREALEDAKGTVSEMGVHIDWVQGSLEKSEAKVKEFQGEINEIREALDAKVEQHNLMRAEWEQEKASLEARLAFVGDALPQQPPASWELEKKELEDKLAELTVERDRMDKDKRYADDEIESWKEQYRNEFIRSQGLRREAEDAKGESSRVQEENAILARQTKEAVKLVTAKYETVVEILRKELGKAESLYKVLQAKDEQTGDDLRRRAASATNLQEEVHRLREELALELAEKAARMAGPEGVQYTCQFTLDNVRCGQGFDSPEELWGHALGHIPPRKHK